MYYWEIFALPFCHFPSSVGHKAVTVLGYVLSL
jgi:hypothetical protein